MAKLTLNALMAALQGAIGNLVITREGDQQYIRPKGETPAPSSPAQLAHLSKFGQASLWAKAVLLDAAVKAAYQKGCHGHLTPHNVAVGDFMNPPQIQSIGLESYTGKPDEIIRINATDDFNITRLPVTIRTVAGELVEEGPAERGPEPGKWLYTTRMPVPPGTTLEIDVAAMDLPGNRVSAKAYFYVQ